MKISEKLIKKVVSNYFGVAESDLEVRDRSLPIRQHRQIYHYLCVKMSGKTLDKIGKTTGHDHATVLHSKNVILNLMENEKQLSYDVDNLMKLLTPQIAKTIKYDYTLKFKRAALIRCKNKIRYEA